MWCGEAGPHSVEHLWTERSVGWGPWPGGRGLPAHHRRQQLQSPRGGQLRHHWQPQAGFNRPTSGRVKWGGAHLEIRPFAVPSRIRFIPGEGEFGCGWVRGAPPPPRGPHRGLGVSSSMQRCFRAPPPTPLGEPRHPGQVGGHLDTPRMGCSAANLKLNSNGGLPHRRGELGSFSKCPRFVC